MQSKQYPAEKLAKKKIHISKGVFLHRDSKIQKGTIIGEYTQMSYPIVIRGIGKVKIGKYCSFGDNVRIISSDHLWNFANLQFATQERWGFRSLYNKGDVIIGNNVFIGESVIILPNVNIGDGAVIGAGSVVTKNISPYSIVAGIPAREIRKRFDDAVIKKMLQIKWWNWPEKKIKKNRQFFEADLNKISAEELESIIK